MKTVATKIVTLGVLVIICIALMYSGVYDVSASRPENRVTKWVLSTTMKRSVRVHARGIKAPDAVDQNTLDEGFEHYDEMCVTCHGAPGIDPSETGQGLEPSAPDLSKVAETWSPGELFWIIKNGIRRTGMPGFGVTHPDDKIWAIVSFVNKLPGMTPGEYEAIKKRVAPEDESEMDPDPSHHQKA